MGVSGLYQPIVTTACSYQIECKQLTARIEQLPLAPTDCLYPPTPPQPPQTLHNPHRNPRPQTNPQPRTRPPIRKKDTAPHHMTPLFPRQFLQRSHIRITRKLKPMNKPTLRRNITSAYRKVGLNQ